MYDAPNAQDRNAMEKQAEVRALTPKETDILGEIGNISMGAAATALSTILGRKVHITTPGVSITTLDTIHKEHEASSLVIHVEYREGFSGSSLYALRTEDVKLITNIMLGGEVETSDEPLTDMHISAISEAMNQMMGAMSTAMADLFETVIKISPPNAINISLGNEDISQLFNQEDSKLVQIRFKLQIEGLEESYILQFLPLGFGLHLTQKLAKETTNVQNSVPRINPEASPISKMYLDQFQTTSLPASSRSNASSQRLDKNNIVTPPSGRTPEARPRSASMPAHGPSVNVHPIQLKDFGPSHSDVVDPNESGIDMILDVPLQITVELGQCRKTVQEILDLNIGSIVTLDKLAGEPVDVVVNGKTVAKGEVIIIEENYGIRITEVISSRIKPSRHI